jgi:predicted DNA-binding transcriptional regulator AlpA
MGDERILNEQEAAKFIGVTVHALRAWRWRKKDGPTYLKLGSCVRYRERDLDTYLESRAVSSAPDRKIEPRRRRRPRRAA